MPPQKGMRESRTGQIALRSIQTADQHLTINASDYVAIKTNQTSREGFTSQLKCLRFWDTGIEVAIDLHKKSRGCHIIDIPKTANSTPCSCLKR